MNATPPGENLGTARGSVIVDTSQPEQAAGRMRRVGRDMESALGRVDSGAKKAESGLVRVSNTIGRLQGQIVGLGATSAILTGLGARMAGNLEVAEIRLKGMTGSLGTARALMDDLRKRAVEAGVPFSDMLAVATRLLPSLNGNTKELERWYGLARRVATLNMQEGLSGAAFAINEALTSGGTDLVSLVERFNISRAQMRAELALNGGDFAAALDTVLKRMGITDQVADEMGQSFQAAMRVGMDAAQQFLAAGITPLLQQMTPLLQSGAAWLSQLQQTNPEVATLTSGLLAALAVAAPLAIAFNQMAEAAKTLKAAGVLGAAGKVAKGGLLAGAGAAIGVGAARGAGAVLGMGETDPAMKARYDRLANYTPEQFWSDARDLLVRVAFDLNDFVTQVLDGLTALASGFAEHVAFMMRAMSDFVGGISDMLPKFAGKDAMQIRQVELRAASDHLIKFAAELRQANTAGSNARSAQVADLTTRLFPVDTINPAEMAQQMAAAEQAASQERTEVITEYYRNVDRIEADAFNQRLAATEQYERQRAETVRQYNQTLAREAEDFARQRQRQEAQLQSQIQKINEDSARQRLRWERDLARSIAEDQADSAERIGKARKETNERLSELDEDYQKNRERAERDHRERLLDAAGSLNAVAVREEQRRFADQSKDAKDAYDERRSDLQEQLQERIEEEKESLAKSIAQQQAAHAQQLADQAENNRLRIEEMKAAQVEQQGIEDEDRAVRLGRMAEDHEAQLAEMARAHGERIAQINAQEQEQLTALANAHNARMVKLGEQLTAYEKMEKEYQKNALERWENYYKALEAASRPPVEAAPYADRPSFLPGFASGGPVNRDMVARVHQGEYVLNAQTVDRLRGNLGNFTQPQLVQAAMGMGGNSKSVTFTGDVNVTIAGTTDMDRNTLRDVAREAVVEALEEYAQ
ncbi:MAG: hypothetical protein IT328_04650 [Caldilineaceae bacterium]|nr:hypothetical protein [Caldilineaceae bacterium]